MRHSGWVVGAVAVVLVGAWLASGARGDDPSLADRVTALERRVAAIEARLDKPQAAAAPRPGRPNHTKVAMMEDLNNLRQIVGLVVVSGRPPMMDGALDVYAFVRNGDIARDQYSILRSARSGTGPTDEEIGRGDYTNFPWERIRGEIPRLYMGPLLWEKQPDEKGQILVGFGDGRAEVLDQKRLDKALGK